jgi:FAD binding domain/Berberine and berberine like
MDLSQVTGKVVTRNSEDYEKSRLCWNRTIDVNPLLIIYCYNEEDVINALKFAEKNSLAFRIRSGGHNYEGYSTGDNLLVIDISNLSKIYIDEENKTVKLGGGVRNREAYEALGSKGYPFPGGGCPTVGIAGLVLGGGWGYSSRYLGLASDSLLEIELIDYNGNKIIANENSNNDLFWACMGIGGGNIGVVVSLTLKLQGKVTNGTLIRINNKNISEEVAVKLVKTLQELYKSLDIRMNLKTAIYNSKTDGIGIKSIGLFYGDEIEAREILNSLTSINEKVELSFDYMPIVECNRWIQDSHPDYEKYKSTGRYLYNDLKEEDIKTLLNLIKERANGAYYTAISLYGLGGKVKEVDKINTAFYYRDAKFIVGFQSVWEEDKFAEENKRWVLDKFNTIKNLTKGSFVNFPLDELESYEEEYYGENLKKIKEIKSKYDPNNFFDFPQVVRGIK